MLLTNKTISFDNIPFQEGVIALIDKPIEWTSFDVVNKIRNIIRRSLNIKKIKVGHAGTLDPLATGLIVVAIGKATKTIDTYQAQTKEYIADIKFGYTTASYDSETEEEGAYKTEHITHELINSILAEKFNGDIQQIPPQFSAKSKDGVRAYKMARKGETVVLDPQTVTIHNIEILQFSNPILSIKINCSKGTYIRSIAHDLGKCLNSGAYLISLKRTKSGNLLNDDALTLEEFEKKASKIKQI